jgi:hypothetical protein
MTKNQSNKNTLTGYVRLNWGAPLIIAFIILLFSATVSLEVGAFSLSDTLATDAFYALVVSVILQIFCFVKYRKTEQIGRSS